MTTLPNDIKKVIIFNAILKIVLSLFLYSVIIIFVIFYYDKLIITTQKGNFIIYIVIFVILAIPFSALKIHRMFLDESWKGIVIEKTYKQILDTKEGFKKVEDLKIKYITNILILDKRGKEHVASFVDEYKEIAEYYKINDEVEHYHGVKWLYNKNNTTKKCICIYCGNICENSDSVCWQCKHTLKK